MGIRATGRPYWQNVHWLEALLFNWFNWLNHWFNWLDHCFNHWLNWLHWLNWFNWLDTLDTFNWLEHQRNGMSTG